MDVPIAGTQLSSMPEGSEFCDRLSSLHGTVADRKAVAWDHTSRRDPGRRAGTGTTAAHLARTSVHS